MNLALIIVAYKAVWVTSVLGREAWWGAVASAIFLSFLATRAPRPGGQRWLLLPAAGFCFGLLTDGFLAMQGGLVFRQDPFLWGLPLWMPTLWAAFAGAIPFLLQKLRHRLSLVALIGAVGGPLAYLATMKLGTLTEAAPWVWPLVAVEWALFPVLALRWAFPTPISQPSSTT